MRKNTRVVIYCFVVLLFVLYLLFANDIVSGITNASANINKIELNEELSKDMVNYSVDTVYLYDDFLQSVSIQLWAFCETDEPNESKELSIILASDNNAYKITGLNTKRQDVNNAFAKTKKIKGNKHGLQCEFSAIPIKNGTYTLYIYCRENDENYGLVKTDVILQKNGSGIKRYMNENITNSTNEEKKESKKCDIDSEAIVSDKIVKCSVDKIDLDNEGYLQIRGWAFVMELESSNQSVYIRLTYGDGSSVTYDTKSTTRVDVGKAYGSKLYDNSGFNALIPIDEASHKDCKIEILVENSNKVYLAEKTYSGESDSLNNEEKERDVDEEKKVSENVSLDISNISSSDNIKYCIDSCSANDSLVINGWVFITDVESSQSKIYLAITSADGSTRVFTTTKRTRTDVAKAYKNELYTESGFTASIPIDAISEGENTITVIADNGQQLLKAEKPYKYSYIPENNKQ